MQFESPAVGQEATAVATYQPSGHHRTSLEALHESADSVVNCEAIAGDTATDRTTTMGLAIAKVVVNHRQRSYRTQDLLTAQPEEWPAGNVRWVSIRGNSSLQNLLSKYGANLLAYDCDQTQVKVEILSFELFETHSRNVRILVRRPEQA
jgi:hypothetical protein